jgi:ATP-dependent Zn protease
LAPDVDFDAVARANPGFSGPDLANLINEAAIIAIRHEWDVIFARDIDEARARVILGRRDTSNALLPEEKRSVAVHETDVCSSRCYWSTPTRWPRSRSCPPVGPSGLPNNSR